VVLRGAIGQAGARARSFDAAAGQLLDLPDFALQSGDPGALFRARIDAHQKLQIERRGNTLFGLRGPPTRFLASNCPSRLISPIANRPGGFADSGSGGI
jgi:hypothetical protein